MRTSFLNTLIARVRHFLVKVELFIYSAIKWLKWPTWFFTILLIGTPLMAVEIVGAWFGFVWPAVGLITWLNKGGGAKIWAFLNSK